MIKSDQFWDELQNLFTLVGQIDDDGHLVRASPLLAEKCRIDLSQHIKFFELFKFKRPTPFNGSMASAREAVGELFLGFSDELGFAIRGQVLDYTEMGIEGLCFVGVPWLWWIEGNAVDSTPTMSDFPVHDVQMDQLFFMSTQQSMVEDLQALNEQLKAAKLEVERANEARQKYFHHVSHEMRTPLNGVISALSLMSDFKLDGKLLEYSELATASADRLLEVINFTLETASLESHMSEAEESAFRLDDLIDECLILARSRSLEKGLELRRSGERDLVNIYTGRLKLLRQVLTNLLSNAVKFSQSGTVTLGALKCESNDSHRDLIEFSVSDQGPGIPANAIEKLFEPFATGLSSETQQAQGTGLGLSIVERFVNALGGEVRVQSSVGEGTIFSFSIPLLLATENTNLQRTEVAIPAFSSAFSGTVLLIGEQKVSQQLNGKVLESMGLKVVTTDSDAAARVLVEAQPDMFDLIFIDLDMPSMHGDSPAQGLLAASGATNIPVLALSAHSTTTDRLKAEQAGMHDLLSKPLLISELRKSLLAHLPATSVASEAGVIHDLIGSQTLSEGVQSSSALNADSMVNGGSHSMGEKGNLEVGDAPQDVLAFDQKPIDRLIREVGITVLDTLVDKFLGESTDRWETLRKAMANEERNIIIREAHTLGSACLTFGLEAAGGSFRRIEAAALAGGSLPTADELPPISEQLGLGINELQHLLSAQRQQ